jgi:hypothetical protein
MRLVVEIQKPQQIHMCLRMSSRRVMVQGISSKKEVVLMKRLHESLLLLASRVQDSPALLENSQNLLWRRI